MVIDWSVPTLYAPMETQWFGNGWVQSVNTLPMVVGHWYRMMDNKPHFMPVDNKPHFMLVDNKPHFLLEK